MPAPTPAEGTDGVFRILVVDDEPAIRDFMAIAFSEEGYLVEKAGSAEEALKILERTPVDTVFSDIRMPGMNGVELLRRIRASMPEIEVVIMTSDATVDTAIAALREGAYDYLLKPVDDVQILCALARRVKEKRDLIEELRAKNQALTRLAAEMAALQDWSRRLALSLDAEILHKTAVDGLSALSGGRICVLYTLPEPRAKFLLTNAISAQRPDISVGGATQRPDISVGGATQRPDISVGGATQRPDISVGGAPHENLTPELPFGTADVPGGRARFAELADWQPLRAELAVRHGAEPAAIHALVVGGEPYGFLAAFSVGGSQRGEAGAGTISQFVAAISTALGNALLYRAVAEATLRDGLTSLYNHRYFQERLTAEIARAERGGTPVSLLFFDIDHFKSLNDRHGHPVGDRVLTAFAEILRNSGRVSDVGARLRSSDIAARYGGEEFCLILPDTARPDARQKAERLRLAVETFPFPGRETQPGKAVTVSIGLAEYPRDATDAKSLIEAADMALYAAKRGGRNRVEEAETPKGTA